MDVGKPQHPTLIMLGPLQNRIAFWAGDIIMLRELDSVKGFKRVYFDSERLNLYGWYAFHHWRAYLLENPIATMGALDSTAT